MPHRFRSTGLWLAFCVAVIGCGGGSVTLPRTAPATAPPASPTPGIIYAGGVAFNAAQFLEFSTAASGNVAPLRTFGASLPFGADRNGVWSVNLAGSVAHYSPAGHLLATLEMQPSFGAAAGATDASGTIYVADGPLGVFNPEDDIFPCLFPNEGLRIDEYAAGSAGLAKPLVTLSPSGGSGCDASSLTVDSRENLWIAEGTISSTQSDAWSVIEYAAHANASQSPVRTIATSANLGPSIAVDSHGYLYVGQDGKLLRYAPTSAVPQTILSGADQYFVALDSQDNVFVFIADFSGLATIEELPPGGGVPVRVIAGAKTLLAGAAGIAVTR